MSYGDGRTYWVQRQGLRLRVNSDLLLELENPEIINKIINLRIDIIT